MTTAKIPVAVVNPGQVRNFAKGTWPAREDRCIGCAGACGIWRRHEAAGPDPIADAETELLKDLLSRRVQLVEMRVAEKNRLETAPGEQPAIRESIKNLIGHLDAEIKRLDKDIDDKIDQTPVWKAKDEILQSIPGVGPGVARTVLAEIPELGMLTRKEIAALGRRRADEPRLRHTSGQADHRRRGRANVRTMLFLSAFAGQRHNDVLRALYLRLRAKGKPAKVAFVACMRKLITIMNAMVRTKTTWDQALAAAR